VFRLGYNTNGLAHHRLLDAVDLLAELGYEGVSVTPDVGQLDPLSPDPELIALLRRRSSDLGLALAVETGARFLLDSRRKHFPTLLEEDAGDRARRVEFLCRSIDLAADLGAGVVSFWAGRAPDGSVGDDPRPDTSAARREVLWTRLVEGARAVLAHGASRGVKLAFEPEPGMFVERPSGYRELCERLEGDGEQLGLCLDVGHLLCTGDLPVGRVVREFGSRLLQVHLDDCKDGVHEHLMFGEGDLDLGDALAALLEVGYRGQAAVELSRDSHRGAWAAGEALSRIRTALRRAERPL
jgi:sugar phosphate isomerase/epimerase